MNDNAVGQRNYLVLGASGGIGSAIAQALLGEGHRVGLAGRNLDVLQSLASGGEAKVQAFDATRFDSIAGFVKEVADWSGGLHGVVNCVGSLLLKPAHLTSQSEFENVISTNLTSAFGVIRAAAPEMRQEGGSIILFSSAAGRIGLGNHEAIAAAKSGIEGLVRSAAATYAAQGVRVNAIAPGLVETPLTERITRSDSALAASRAMHPLGRIGQPQDIVPLVEWLLSPISTWVTGQIIGVDGGLASLKTREARAAAASS